MYKTDLLILLYLLAISIFIIILNFGPNIIIPLIILILFSSLLFVESKTFFFYLVSILIAIRPITIDMFFWKSYIFGFKITHIFSVFMIALGFLLIFKLKVKIRNFHLWILPTLFFLYHFFMFLNSIQSGNNFYISLDYLLRACSGIPFFFVLGHLIEDEKQFIKFLKILLIPLLILIALSTIFTFYRIDEFYMITGSQKQFWRIKLFYHDSTQMVIYLVIALIILCYLFIKEKKFYYLFLIYLTFIPIYATQTRSAWISSILIFLFLVLYLRKPQYLLPVIAFIILNLDEILKRWDYAGLEFDEDTGLSGRAGLWKIGIAIYLNSNPIEQFFGSLKLVLLDTHNQYVYWLLANGLFGLFFNLAILLMLSLRAFLLSKDPILVFTFLWLFISNFLGNFLNMPNVNIFFWTILGYLLKKRENLSRP